MSGLLSRDTTLAYHDETVWKEFELLMEVPNLGSDPQEVDATHLKSRRQQALPGLDSGPTLDFKFLYEGGEDGDYAIMKGFQAAGTTKDFRVQYPDGSAHYFKAKVAVRMDAAQVNAALTFTTKIFMQSDITDVEPNFTP
jgi:hypothetical protein